MDSGSGKAYTYIPEIEALAEAPPDSIVSRTVHRDEQVKVVLFAFAPGQELSEHTASTAAVIHVLRGEATLVLGQDTVPAGAGTWVHMPPQLPHSVRAHTSVVMLLLLLQRGPGDV